jgi:hypothetical protein
MRVVQRLPVMPVKANGLTIKSVGNLLKAGVHFALQALFYIDDQVLKAVHLAGQLIHLAGDSIYLTGKLLYCTDDLLKFAHSRYTILSEAQFTETVGTTTPVVGLFTVPTRRVIGSASPFMWKPGICRFN